MRIERMAPVVGLALALVAPACGSVLQEPDAGHDGGVDSGNDAIIDVGPDGGSVCSGLGETACRAQAGCTVATCPGFCGAPPSFVACYDAVNQTPPPCIGIGAASCPLLCSAITNEATCMSRSDCRANYCPNCNGGTSFSYCSDVTATAASICPAIACPASCSLMTTKDACDARPDCHAVYVDNGACDCSTAGCCAHFSRCADGPAVCAPPPAFSCTTSKPYCESPAYYVSYSGGCYEGCATAAACGIK
jgi:hypothetical protein